MPWTFLFDFLNISGYNYFIRVNYNEVAGTPMSEYRQTRCTAFEGARRIASGELKQVALMTNKVMDRGPRAPVLIFDDVTSELIEVDFRGTPDAVLKRLSDAPDRSEPASETAPRPVGRPKLGVIAREITLLPRHWDWLNSQPGGASVALRKLVEQARRVTGDKDRVRQAQEAAYRFMSAMAGNEPGFEEATRALFAGNPARFDEQIESWPIGVRDHAKKLATGVFGAPPTQNLSD
jgi:hypothetical protein